jgi:hypothetical protein
VGPLADTPEEAIRQLLKAMEEPRYEIEWGFEPDLAEEVGRAIGESIDRWIMSQLVPDITAEITIDDEH